MDKKDLLYDYQRDAVDRMHNGCILCGSVGSGKSRTGLAYFFELNGGIFKSGDKFREMVNPKDLYIITVASKRDKGEWDHELIPFRMHTNPELNYYKNKVVVDSWNNLKKYVGVEGAVFILDEQRLVGWGQWTKSFLKIARKNQWFMLSATPGDNFSQYLPVWVANGYFRNKTEFNAEHVVFSQYAKYPKIDRYLDVRRLERLRQNVLVDMDYVKRNTQHHEYLYCDYDILAYKAAMKTRWNPFTDQPMQNAAEMCYVLRKIVNLHESRESMILEMMEDHPKLIIFYNFDDERDQLLAMCHDMDIEVTEWTGHAHQPVPTGKKWIYLCQYTAAAEGWEATTTDTIIFYSQNYSYKMMVQAAGRIDRMNTPFRDLYYYHLVSNAPIDRAIAKALKNKKKFNEGKFVKW